MSGSEKKNRYNKSNNSAKHKKETCLVCKAIKAPDVKLPDLILIKIKIFLSEL